MEILEREEKGMQRVFKTINDENFLNLQREMDVQIYEAQKTPKQVECEQGYIKQILINLPKVKDKERILKAAREKREIIHNETHEVFSGFLNRNFSDQERM